MRKLIFVLGAAESGKSRVALDLAKKMKGEKHFVATCLGKDREMKVKIAKHRAERPFTWKTIEAGQSPFQIHSPNGKLETVLVDSLTLWVALSLEKRWDRKEVEEKANDFLVWLEKNCKNAVVVSDEVGMGIVPENSVSRRFRAYLGAVNQIFAKGADQFYWVAAGVPVALKNRR